MADVFISYSQRDAIMAAHLTAHLEAEGYSVWYDRELGAADRYRDEIARELRAAKAVLVVWSSSSINSDWVRGEAGLARFLGTLIPLKTPEVTYHDIPLPFGEHHTISVSKFDEITEAVSKQVSRPNPPLGFFRLWAGIRSQAFATIGIVGTALTVLGNLRGLITLSELASRVLDRWEQINIAFWVYTGQLLRIGIPDLFTPAFSLSAFSLLLAFGTRQPVRDTTERAKQIAIALGLATLHVAAILAIVVASKASMFAITIWSDLQMMSLLPTLLAILARRDNKVATAINGVIYCLMAIALLILPMAMMMIASDKSILSILTINHWLRVSVSIVSLSFFILIMVAQPIRLLRRLTLSIALIASVVGVSYIHRLFEGV